MTNAGMHFLLQTDLDKYPLLRLQSPVMLNQNSRLLTSLISATCEFATAPKQRVCTSTMYILHPRLGLDQLILRQ